jgi:adenylate cyclase
LASEHFLRALHLNPLDAHNFVMMSGLAFAHFFAGRNDEAHLWAEKALADNPNYLVILRVLAASASGPDKARAIGKKLMTINPAESVSATPIFPLLRRQEDRIRWQAALRIAGLPD